MKNGSRFADKVKQYLLYGGICKEEYDQVKKPVGQANHKALTYWSALVPFFWIYCLLMSLNSAEYAACRPAYAAALGSCVAIFLCTPLCDSAASGYASPVHILLPAFPSAWRRRDRGLPAEPALADHVCRRHCFALHFY